MTLKENSSKIKVLFLLLVVTIILFASINFVSAKILSCSEDNPVSLWHLNNNSFDTCGGINGTETSISYTTYSGYYSQSAYFNSLGTSNITFGNNFNFERNESFSLSFWIKLSGQTDTPHQSSPLRKSDIIGGVYRGYFLSIQSDAKINMWLISNSGTGNYIQNQYASSIPCGVSDLNSCSWNNIVITYNGSSIASGYKLYLNGNLVSTTTLKNNLTDTIISSIPFNFGQNLRNGLLDEVAIFNRTLTSTEVLRYYREASSLSIQFVLPSDNTGNLNKDNIIINITSSNIINNFTNLTIKLFNSTSLINTTNYLTNQSYYYLKYQNLSAGYYYVNATTFDDVGISNSTETRVYNVSGQATTTPTISNIQSSLITDISAKITWDTDISSNSSIKYGTSISNLNLSAGFNDNVVSHSIVLTLLINNTIYYYNVTSCVPTGCSSLGIYNFTTATPTTPIISSVSASAGYYSANLTWTTNVNSNSSVCYSKLGFSNCPTGIDNFITSHIISIAGLTDNTLYSYNVTSCFGSRCSTSSNYNFTTPRYFPYSQASNISSVYVKDNQIFKRDETTNIIATCYDTSLNFCNGLTNCSISVTSPNSNVSVDNQLMAWNTNYYSYSIPTDILGDYSGLVVCKGTGINAKTTFNYQVTPNGEISSTSKAFLYIGILIILVLLCGFLIYYAVTSNHHIVARASAFLFAYLLLIAISFIAWNLSNDYLTSSPFLTTMFKIIFYFLLIAFLPLLLAVIIYSLYMILKIKEIQKLIDEGMPEDEAYERSVKNGFRRLGGKKRW